MTGITYAVVALSKESRVGDGGVMVVKGSDAPVSTGEGAGPRGLLLRRDHLDLDSQPAGTITALQGPAQ
jgi:hypothetical protein